MTALRDPEPNLNGQAAGALRARRMPAGEAGTGIALALGGGFSRGFAHLGVLEVLEEEQMPISCIVGTSIGGLLGAAYADGIALRDLCDLGRRVRVRDFLRFHQSEQGTQSIRKDCIGKFVQEWFRATSVEELSIPTAIVSTDLATGAPYVFTRGPLEVAVRATCAFPGLVKPVEYEGRLLADGCIAAPVPTAIAARINGGYVLGVSVGSNEASSLSSENMVKVFDSGFRASHRSALEPSWSRHADILLEPQVHQIDWNDFSRVDEAFAAGAEAMRRALPSLRELLDRRLQFAPTPDKGFGPERGLAL
jgi:NTE family protein